MNGQWGSSSSSANPMPFGGFGGGGQQAGGSYGAAPSQPQMTPEQQQAYYIRLMQDAMESCPVKSGIAGGMGFGMGAIFGLFMSSLDIQSTEHQIYQKPFKEQMKFGLQDMGKRSYSTAKNFAVVGAIYAGTECCIEGYRAKHDMTNSVAAGCVTGAILARKGGPKAAAFGCAGFAAFSAASKSCLFYFFNCLINY